jgi:N-acetylglucosamine-6-phosphate deacetylase
MSSSTPAKVMGLTDRGEIAVGKRADMVVLDENYQIEKVVFKGEYI